MELLVTIPLSVIIIYNLLLPGLLNGRELLHDLLLGRVEGGVVVEEVGHEGEVESLLALHHVLGGDEGPALQLVGLVQHLLGPGDHVLDVHGLLVDPGRAGGDLVEQLGVDLTVFNILVEVPDSPVRPGLQRKSSILKYF